MNQKNPPSWHLICGAFHPQISSVAKVLNKSIYSIVSVFAGRIADTGIDPMPMMKEAVTKRMLLSLCLLI